MGRKAWTIQSRRVYRRRLFARKIVLFIFYFKTSWTKEKKLLSLHRLELGTERKVEKKINFRGMFCNILLFIVVKLPAVWAIPYAN